MAIKPSCASCRQPVDRLQRSLGIVAAYPCRCWLTVEQADMVRRHFRELVAAADDRAQVD